MKLISDSRSVVQNRPSILAISETIFASGLSAWVAFRFDSIDHIIVASALAPFFLLRTRLSIRYTLYILNRVDAFIDKAGSVDRGIIFLSALFPALPILKLACSFRCFIRHPLAAFQRLPLNYYKGVFVLDFGISPHFIPDYNEHHKYSHTVADLDLYNILNDFKREIFASKHKNKHSLKLRDFGVYVLFLPVIIASVSLRMAIKSTALFWLPLLWVIWRAQAGANATDRLLIYSKDPIIKVSLFYSLIVFVGFCMKILLLWGIWHWRNIEEFGNLGEFITKLVDPINMPLWQIASAFNAFLAWLLYFRSKYHLLAIQTTERWDDASIRAEYAVFQIIRTTISIYTIVCTFYIAIETARMTQWPSIKIIIFPWS